jgi:hypothetical protein
MNESSMGISKENVDEEAIEKLNQLYSCQLVWT